MYGIYRHILQLAFGYLLLICLEYFVEILVQTKIVHYHLETIAAAVHLPQKKAGYERIHQKLVEISVHKAFYLFLGFYILFQYLQKINFFILAIKLSIIFCKLQGFN